MGFTEQEYQQLLHRVSAGLRALSEICLGGATASPEQRQALREFQKTDVFAELSEDSRNRIRLLAKES